MTRYRVTGNEEFPVLHLSPVGDGHGVVLPAALYGRWQRARAELDAAQDAVVGYVRTHAGVDALPAALRDSHDHPPDEPRSDRAWKLS